MNLLRKYIFILRTDAIREIRQALVNTSILAISTLCTEIGIGNIGKDWIRILNNL